MSRLHLAFDLTNDLLFLMNDGEIAASNTLFERVPCTLEGDVRLRHADSTKLVLDLIDEGLPAMTLQIEEREEGVVFSQLSRERSAETLSSNEVTVSIGRNDRALSLQLDENGLIHIKW